MIDYLLPVLAYLFGSISTAVLVSRLMGFDDPRAVGSGNPGATNVLRHGGKTAAGITLAGDLLKGLIPVLIARVLAPDAVILSLVGLLAFIGHLYPIFFGLRGGKGVATALGVWLGLSPWIGLALAGTWLLTALGFRYSSLSALVAAALTPLYVWILLPQAPFVALSFVMSGLLIARHRSNIRNLMAGKEHKIDT